MNNNLAETDSQLDTSSQTASTRSSLTSSDYFLQEERMSSESDRTQPLESEEEWKEEDSQNSQRMQTEFQIPTIHLSPLYEEKNPDLTESYADLPRLKKKKKKRSKEMCTTMDSEMEEVTSKRAKLSERNVSNIMELANKTLFSIKREMDASDNIVVKEALMKRFTKTLKKLRAFISLHGRSLSHSCTDG